MELADLWRKRYEIEDNLEHIYSMEELYWQQRGRYKGVLEGDSNSKFFHLSGNGRRRKKQLFRMKQIMGRSSLRQIF